MLPAVTTWSVTGPDVAALRERLRALPGVDMVAAFGTALHVTGTDAAAMEASIAPLRHDGAHVWEKAKPSLEDVFIHTLARIGGDRR